MPIDGLSQLDNGTSGGIGMSKGVSVYVRAGISKFDS